jgi:hypothetical protein
MRLKTFDSTLSLLATNNLGTLIDDVAGNVDAKLEPKGSPSILGFDPNFVELDKNERFDPGGLDGLSSPKPRISMISLFTPLNS